MTLINRLRTTLTVLVAALTVVGSACAADVDLVLTVQQFPNGSALWALSAAARSGADNDGLAGFNIDVTGITNAHHESPLVALNPNLTSPTAGFTIGGVDFNNSGTLFAAQNQFVPGSRIYGVGELGAVPPVSVPGFFVRNIPWNYPVVLATGLAPSLLGPNFGQSTNVTVWSQGQAASGGVRAEFANVFPSIVRIPFGVNAWTFPGSGSWNAPTNWQAGVVPNLNGAQAGFRSAISSPATVTVNSSVTVNRMEFDNAVPYTIASTGSPSITLAGNAVIHVASGSHTISAPLAGANGLTKTGSGTLTLSGPKLYAGNAQVSAGSLVVQNVPLPGERIDVAAGAVLRLRQFVNYQLPPNQTLSGSGNVVLEDTFSNTELVVGPTNAVRGSLSIQADNVINTGLIAPGFSPGIIRIDGDYTQENDGVLEMEIGGPTPGTQHDQLIVTGSASLGGRLEVPLINNFVPAANQEFTILTAGGVSGRFEALSAPGLAERNLAIEILYEPTHVGVRYAVPFALTGIPDSEPAVAQWSNADIWPSDSVPETIHLTTVQNSTNFDRRIDVETENAFSHELLVFGNENTMTVGVKNALNLSATAGVTIARNGVVELDVGNLISSLVSVEAGGQLTGNGKVVGDIAVGAPSGAQPAIVSPGFPVDGAAEVGHVEVDGNFRQTIGGTLQLDVNGTQQGQFDTVGVTGSVELGGTLRIDATKLTTFTPGVPITIMTAGSLNGEFTRVESTNNDVFFLVDYVNSTGGTFGGEAGAATGSAVGQATASALPFFRGDMNANGEFDPKDVDLFILVLMNPSEIKFFDVCECRGNENQDRTLQERGDLNGNNHVDFDDIPQFQQRMAGAGMSALLFEAALDRYRAGVPEPPSAALLLIAALAIRLRPTQRGE